MGLNFGMLKMDSLGTGLIVNLALLICLTFVYAALRRWLPAERPHARSVVTGILFGAIALLGMQIPVQLAPGIILDGRNVLLALAGPFGGAVAAAVAAVLVAGYRLYLGGFGALAGIGSIITAALLGVIALRLREDRTDREILPFCFLLGLAVSAASLLWIFALPDFQLALGLIKKLALPIMIGFTALTMLLGYFLHQYDGLRRGLAELAVAREDLKQYGEASGEWFWDQDADLRYIQSPLANAPDEKYDPARLFGATRWELADADPDTDQLWHEHRADLLNRRPFRDFEYSTRDRDGDRLVIRTSGFPIFDRFGTFAGYRGTSRDVTNEVQQKEKALAAQTMLTNAIQGLGSAIALYDADDRLVACNDFYRELAQPRADVLVPGTPFETIVRVLARSGVIPFDDEADEAWVQWRLAKHARPSEPLEMRRPDGRVFLQHEQRLPGGETILVLFEITEREKAEEALRESEERYRTLTVGSLQGIGIIQEDKMVFANDALAKLLGYRKEEMLGADVNDFIMPKYREMVGARRNERLRNRSTPEHYDFQARHRDGHGIWVDQLAQTLIWEGRPATQVSIIDISQRKAAEVAVIAAKEEAEQANRAKSQFLANFSHELRTPLNAIIGFSEIMQQKLFGPLGDERYADYANDIHQSGEHLLSLISDILDLSRIEAGQLDRAEQIFEVDPVAEDCVRLLSSRAEDKGVTIDLHLGAEGARLRADERQLRQVLLNLLSNAVKFTRADTIVTLSNEINGDGNLCFHISDAGAGMTAEDIERVQQPFIRLESALTSSEEGTGLGLAITKRLLESHGGSLQLNSEVGAGTTAAACFPSSRVVR
jgi:PAS domain S-box-containing protein